VLAEDLNENTDSICLHPTVEGKKSPAALEPIKCTRLFLFFFANYFGKLKLAVQLHITGGLRESFACFNRVRMVYKLKKKHLPWPASKRTEVIFQLELTVCGGVSEFIGRSFAI